MFGSIIAEEYTFISDKELLELSEKIISQNKEAYNAMKGHLSIYYSTVNNIVLTFSEITHTSDGSELIIARFTRTNESDYDCSDWLLPYYACSGSHGFSQAELAYQKRYLMNNSPLIWEIAKEHKEMK